jgi:hypothetical protein
MPRILSMLISIKFSPLIIRTTSGIIIKDNKEPRVLFAKLGGGGGRGGHTGGKPGLYVAYVHEGTTILQNDAPDLLIVSKT